MRQVIIGLGSGRCGTMSLAHLFDIQDGCGCTHEEYNTDRLSLRWKDDLFVLPYAVINLLLNYEETVGDVGWYWLNYVPFIVGYIPNVRFVCLQRDRDETIDSYRRRRDNQIAMFGPDGANSPMFPMYQQYDNIPPDEKLALYYDEYYAQAESHEKFYPNNFRIFSIENLNTEEGQKEILDFAGFKNHRYKVGVKLNANPNGGKD